MKTHNRRTKMARPLSKWRHPRHPNHIFNGSYDKTIKQGKRVFVLERKGIQGSVIDKEVFESHEKAKDAKWEKIQ
jgi:hypothetical protein